MCIRDREYIDQYVKNEINLKNYVRVSAAVERDAVPTGDSTILTLRYEMNAFPNFSFGTDITQIPVSYTHLDVYKRQVTLAQKRLESTCVKRL